MDAIHPRDRSSPYTIHLTQYTGIEHGILPGSVVIPIDPPSNQVLSGHCIKLGWSNIDYTCTRSSIKHGGIKWQQHDQWSQPG